MSAIEALNTARAAGVQFGMDGDDLVLEASVPPPPAVIDLLSRHKAEVVALLRPAEDGWSAEDWLAFYNDRLGIAEFDGGLPREEAEAHAFACCVVEWQNRNAVRSPAGRCHCCGQAEHAHDPPLPFGTESTGHAWLHSRCWPAWYEFRKAKAVAALAAMGITAPVGRPINQEQQSQHLQSDAAREPRPAKNQFAFHRQMNGG